MLRSRAARRLEARGRLDDASSGVDGRAGMPFHLRQPS